MIFNGLGIGKIWRGISRNIVKILLTMGVFVSLYLGFNYKNLSSAFLNLFLRDQSLKSRIMLLNISLRNYSISVFGQRLNIISSTEYLTTTGKYAVLDNAYLYCLLAYGIINSVIIVFVYYKTIRYMVQKRDFDYIGVLLIFVISGFFEKYFINPMYNFTLFAMGCAFLKRKPDTLARQEEMTIYTNLNP